MDSPKAMEGVISEMMVEEVAMDNREVEER